MLRYSIRKQKWVNDMTGNGSISSQNAIIQLEKLIGIERQSDFAEPNFSQSNADQIHSNALTMSEYAEEALNQIRCQLGYLPRRDVTFPSEPAIRQLLYEYDHKHGDIDTLFDSCDPHIDEIYERDMEPHAIDDYPEEIYRLYNTLFLELKDAARSRIIHFADHEPGISLSIYAELLMRCRMADAKMPFDEKRTEADYEAQSIVWFRKVSNAAL
ncbi:hypothetical protein BEL04_18195 [Mucilaginibacter sp. PPCGB 2223]|uniref:hypothetical protein n=1 Tax=Mucilaginibacter sp. PPCGB 2223 TaxID=1886027 RepID=UPI0008247415|nr:hypothetical protein [Mucilaginibacter sp. PPCGB 2223]OCX51933.1 hypothetical protein BEL04_18195 [Mucilaginibacter sp. PPCGB 2223]